MKLTRKPPPPPSIRGSGRSTLQIVTAPADALYVVPTQSHITYAKELAKFRGRTDLEVVSVFHEFRGLRRPITIDHYCFDHMGTIYYINKLKLLVEQQLSR